MTGVLRSRKHLPHLLPIPDECGRRAAQQPLLLFEHLHDEIDFDAYLAEAAPVLEGVVVPELLTGLNISGYLRLVGEFAQAHSRLLDCLEEGHSLLPREVDNWAQLRALARQCHEEAKAEAAIC